MSLSYTNSVILSVLGMFSSASPISRRARVILNQPEAKLKQSRGSKHTVQITGLCETFFWSIHAS